MAPGRFLPVSGFLQPVPPADSGDDQGCTQQRKTAHHQPTGCAKWGGATKVSAG